MNEIKLKGVFRTRQTDGYIMTAEIIHQIEYYCTN